MNRMNRFRPSRATQQQTMRVKQQQAMARQAREIDQRGLGEKRDRPSPPSPTEPAA